MSLLCLITVGFRYGEDIGCAKHLYLLRSGTYLIKQDGYKTTKPHLCEDLLSN